jgi:serine/threonine protein kinase
MPLSTDEDRDPFASLCGTTVGRWLIRERFDSGSFGVVFRAELSGHPEAGPFAVKMAKQSWDERMEREVELLQRVKHPAVPRFEDAGVWTSPKGHRYPYVAMEWIAGFTLYDWFREAARTHRDVFHVLAQVTRGIEAVHATGAVHRDVKGDNIRVTPEGRAVLLDFGSGWYPGARPLTDTCAPPGTTPYRPPELLRFMWRNRKDMEARWYARPSDDLYSLGVTAYRLVTGTYLPPVTETGDNEARKRLRPSQLATVAPELEAIIVRLLSEDREERGTATKAAADMERGAQQAPPAIIQPILPKSVAAPEKEEIASSDAPPSSSDSDPTRPAPSSEPSPHSKAQARSILLFWLPWAGAVAMGTALTPGIAQLRHVLQDRTEPLPPTAEKWMAPTVEAPDAGVGDMGLASAHAFPRDPAPNLALGLPMPKQPFPGQRRPPCDPDAERAINGGCWIGPITSKKPPCGTAWYDYDGGCYAPHITAPRQPTSDPP